jgi:hypothetical protein
MKETKKTVERPLAPRPVKQASWVVVLDRAVTLTVTLTVAGGVFLTLLAGLFRPTMGGRRSTRLEWDARRQQIRAAAVPSDAGASRP